MPGIIPPGFPITAGQGQPKKPTGPLKPSKPTPGAFLPSAIYGNGIVVSDAQGNLIGKVNIKGIQKTLIARGYEINKTGKMDALTKSALADFLQPNKNHPVGRAVGQLLKGTTITSKRNPKAWSARFGINRKTKMVERPILGKNGQLNQFGNDSAPPGGTSDGGPVQASAGGYAAPRQMPMDPSMAGQGLEYLPDSYADDQAGLQYDASIRDAQVAQARLPRQTEQDLHDINTWYGQAQESQKTAATRDATIGQQSKQSIQDSVQAIIASLGGSANAGSGVVGAAGADAVGTAGAISQSQDQYNTDMAPIMALEKAGALTGETNRQHKSADDLVQQLINLHGQRGQAKSGALMGIKQYNQGLRDTAYTRAQQIKQYNDQLKQQGFTNQMAIGDQQVAAALAGAKLKSATAGKPAQWSFGKLSSADRAEARNNMVSAVQSNLQNTKSVPQAVSYLGTLIRSQGWSFSNPQVKSFAFNILQLAGISPDPKWYNG